MAAAAPAVPPAPAGDSQPSSGQPVGMIYFRDGSASLSPDDLEVLRQIAEMQRAYGGVIDVVGHASMGAADVSYGGQEDANQRISEARANAVAQELLRYGVPQSAIRVSAVGASQPLYPEAMPSGQAGNRRADVYLTAY
jgi:outer membrane protein OmpA-like peptidoglycan-associated protein